jgi:hypothetical protein
MAGMKRWRALGVNVHMNILDDFVEVSLKEPSDFLKIKETLTRIGIKSKGTNTLSQTCHILHKAGKYYIVHFKQMFMLDNKQTNFSDDDIARLNYIVTLLQQWGLITVVSSWFKPSNERDVMVKIVPWRDKQNWTLVQKYSIGNKP